MKEGGNKWSREWVKATFENFEKESKGTKTTTINEKGMSCQQWINKWDSTGSQITSGRAE